MWTVWLTLRNGKLLALAALIGWRAWGEWRVSRREARIAVETLQAARDAAARTATQRLRERAEALAAADAAGASCQR